MFGLAFLILVIFIIALITGVIYFTVYAIIWIAILLFKVVVVVLIMTIIYIILKQCGTKQTKSRMKSDSTFLDIKLAFAKEKAAIDFAQQECEKKIKAAGVQLVNHEITPEVYEAKIVEIKAKRQQAWDEARKRNTKSV